MREDGGGQETKSRLSTITLGGLMVLETQVSSGHIGLVMMTLKYPDSMGTSVDFEHQPVHSPSMQKAKWGLQLRHWAKFGCKIMDLGEIVVVEYQETTRIPSAARSGYGMRVNRASSEVPCRLAAPSLSPERRTAPLSLPSAPSRPLNPWSKAPGAKSEDDNPTAPPTQPLRYPAAITRPWPWRMVPLLLTQEEWYPTITNIAPTLDAVSQFFRTMPPSIDAALRGKVENLAYSLCLMIETITQTRWDTHPPSPSWVGQDYVFHPPYDPAQDSALSGGRGLQQHRIPGAPKAFQTLCPDPGTLSQPGRLPSNPRDACFTKRKLTSFAAAAKTAPSQRMMHTIAQGTPSSSSAKKKKKNPSHTAAGPTCKQVLWNSSQLGTLATQSPTMQYAMVLTVASTTKYYTPEVPIVRVLN
ncbi:hypothetical protein DFP72DRAFT_859164 [Ephemerocybe angulata]|uniref:Uncharacterized protein n=1 Tax=Ephemerocybe angulata TaxID=980116 RepID=A0A8H6LUK8_9AGAR|nr:hypothetical protein DFP72DRAFT_859164 [Tulosesus angulatus]